MRMTTIDKNKKKMTFNICMYINMIIDIIIDYDKPWS
jgi:hypothetical protein